jgi:hypothetical protein
MVCDSRRIQQDEQRDTNGNHRERTEHWLRNGACVGNRVGKAEIDKGREQIKSVGKMIAPVHCMQRP